MKKFLFLLLIFSLTFTGLIPAQVCEAASASLYFTPSTGTYVVGSSFSVGVNANTGGVSVNASQGTITFDNSILKVTGVSKGGSIFSLWTQEPAVSGNAISFGGGVPNPGYTGTGGRIITISFQAIKVGTADVRFSSGSVLANDGKGTNILSAMGSASFNISPRVEVPKKPGEVPKKEVPKEEAVYLKPVITSETHPDEDKWYNKARAKFSWELPDIVEGVSISFDEKEVANPGPKPDGLFDSKEYVVEEDGHWYLHVKFRDNKGRWGTIAHFRINVDTQPPKPFDVEVRQDDPNDWPTLYFETTDDLSGVDRYEVSIDDLQKDPVIVEADEKSLKIFDLDIGKHTAVVRAIDRAGNEIFTSTEFEIMPIPTPTIDEYSEEITPGDTFFASGGATPNTSIKLFIKRDGEEDINSYQARSDKDGNWVLIARDEFEKGRYTFWVEAINDKGLKSKPSAKLSFLVTPPVFAKIGSFVINYFTVIVSLLFMIILIIFLLLFIMEMIRKKLKKETREIKEVLDRNMKALREEINGEIDALSKLSKSDFNKRKSEAKRHLNSKVDETNKKILKEVRDVEKILK